MINSLPRKKTTRALIGILLLNTLLSIGVMLAWLFNPAYAIGEGFGIPYTDDMAQLGSAVGLQAMFLISIMVLSIVWIRKRKIEWPLLAVIVGVFFTLFGVVMFLQFGTIDGLIIDSTRGVVTFVLAMMTYKHFKSQE